MGLLDMIWKSLSGDKSKDDVLDTVLSELVPGTDQEVTTAEDKKRVGLEHPTLLIKNFSVSVDVKR